MQLLKHRKPFRIHCRLTIVPQYPLYGEKDKQPTYPFRGLIRRKCIVAARDRIHRHVACEGIFNARSTPIQGQDLDATSVRSRVKPKVHEPNYIPLGRQGDESLSGFRYAYAHLCTWAGYGCMCLYGRGGQTSTGPSAGCLELFPDKCLFHRMALA